MSRTYIDKMSGKITLFTETRRCLQLRTLLLSDNDYSVLAHDATRTLQPHCSRVLTQNSAQISSLVVPGAPSRARHSRANSFEKAAAYHVTAQFFKLSDCLRVGWARYHCWMWWRAKMRRPMTPLLRASRFLSRWNLGCSRTSKEWYTRFYYHYESNTS